MRQALDNRHRDRIKSRQAANARITRPSAGMVTNPGDLMLVKEAVSMIHRISDESNLERERWVGLWKVG